MVKKFWVIISVLCILSNCTQNGNLISDDAFLNGRKIFGNNYVAERYRFMKEFSFVNQLTPSPMMIQYEFEKRNDVIIAVEFFRNGQLFKLGPLPIIDSKFEDGIFNMSGLIKGERCVFENGKRRMCYEQINNNYNIEYFKDQKTKRHIHNANGKLLLSENYSMVQGISIDTFIFFDNETFEEQVQVVRSDLEPVLDGEVIQYNSLGNVIKKEIYKLGIKQKGIAD